MKFLFSSLMFLMLAHPVQEDQNRYLLIFTALVPANSGTITLAADSGPFHYNGDSFISGGQIQTLPNNQWLYTSHYDAKNQVFSSFEDAQNFVHNHTVHYLDNGAYTQPWDFTITSIEGFYKLHKLDSQKIQTGTHTEMIQTTQQTEVPSYEWSINE